MAITHEYEIAWKRVLHYFDLHLNKRLNKQPPCWLLNALRRRQVTVMASLITGQSNVCSTVCSDCQQRNIKGPRYCPFVMRSHCDRWFPTQKESNMENAFIWWRHNGLKDTMTAHVSYYAIYTLHYSHKPNNARERSECWHPAGFFVIAGFDSLGQQATVLDARASRVKWPAQFMSHWYGILFTE